MQRLCNSRATSADTSCDLRDDVETYDPDRVLILTVEHVHDERFEVGSLYIGLSGSPAAAPEIIHHDVDVLIVGIGDDRRCPASSKHTQYSTSTIQPRLKRLSADSFLVVEHGTCIPHWFGTKESEMEKKANKQTARGRTQDRARVAGGQDYEVRYEAKKTGRSKAAVKKAVRKVGSGRKRVERRLGR
jgi:Protein of unknown function (DUF3606)